MRLLPVLAGLLGCAGAAHPQPQPLGPTDDASSVAVPPAGLTSPSPPLPGAGGRDRDCGALDGVLGGVDTAAEGAVHAGAAGLASLYVCRRAGGRDCGLVGGFGAAAAASLFLLLARAGVTAGGARSLPGDFAWPSADTAAYCASAGSLAYLLYRSVWSGLAAPWTGAWLSFTFFQALMLLYRGFGDDAAPGEQTRLLLLGWGQTGVCLVAFFLSAASVYGL